MKKPHSTVGSRMAGLSQDWLDKVQEPILEPDRVGVARERRIKVDAGGHGIERPALALEHEHHLVAVAHVAVGEDVVLGHPASLTFAR